MREEEGGMEEVERACRREGEEGTRRRSKVARLVAGTGSHSAADTQVAAAASTGRKSRLEDRPTPPRSRQRRSFSSRILPRRQGAEHCPHSSEVEVCRRGIAGEATDAKGETAELPEWKGKRGKKGGTVLEEEGTGEAVSTGCMERLQEQTKGCGTVKEVLMRKRRGEKEKYELLQSTQSCLSR